MAKAKVAQAKMDQKQTEVSPRGRTIEVVGEVISNKMQKTISVQVYRMIRHAKYGKIIKRTSVFKAHDEKGLAQVGDIVRIHETRPMSKTKRWALTTIVESAKK